MLLPNAGNTATVTLAGGATSGGASTKAGLELEEVGLGQRACCGRPPILHRVSHQPVPLLCHSSFRRRWWSRRARPAVPGAVPRRPSRMARNPAEGSRLNQSTEQRTAMMTTCQPLYMSLTSYCSAEIVFPPLIRHSLSY